MRTPAERGELRRPTPAEWHRSRPRSKVRACMGPRLTGFHDLRRKGAGRSLRGFLRMWRLYVLRAVARWAPTEAQRLLALTVAIGAACGLAAVAFHLAIRAAEGVFIDRAMAAPGHAWIVWTVVTPTAGAAVAGILLAFVVPNARGSGIPLVKATFGARGKQLRLRDSVGKFVIGALQIGTGSSLGREGPTVQICAGIATALGRAAGVSPRSLRRLLPVGAAAGIAAAFNAPIAAVTFTIEEVVGTLDRAVLSGVIVAAALAAAIERSVLGESPVFEIPRGYGLHHASSLVLYALLGVAAGLLSVVFTDSLLGLRAAFRRQSTVPAFLQPAVGGLVTGLLAVAAIGLFDRHGVTGGGYATLSLALSGSLTVRVMLALCVFKVIATVFSYSSGGAGGIFAPALFIGGMLGGAMGEVDVRLLHHGDNSLGAFALVGMGAAFAGIVRAPMTSVLIIAEMTGGYALILPLMIANATAYGIARKLRPTPIYEALLAQDGIHPGDGAVMDVLERIPLAGVYVRDHDFVCFSPGDTGEAIAHATHTQDVYPVVDAAGTLVGIVTEESLGILREEPGLMSVVNVSDLMDPPVAVRDSDDLHMALETMLAKGVRQLPVLDATGHVGGYVDEGVIARAYLHGHGGDLQPLSTQ